jgi:hypothetical protein
MHFSTLLALLPTAALAASYCPRDFPLNTTMAEGPCTATPLLRIRGGSSSSSIIITSSLLLPTSLPRVAVAFANGTALERGNFRLWNDDAYGVVAPAMAARVGHGAVGLAGKVDVGIYAPVCVGDGVCGRKTF